MGTLHSSPDKMAGTEIGDRSVSAMGNLKIVLHSMDESGQIVVGVEGEFTARTREDMIRLVELSEDLARRSPTPTGVVLDMSEIEKIDSMGMGDLLKLYTVLKKVGTALSVVGANANVRQSLSVTSLDRLISVGGND